jgi:hypothetical protein
VPTAEAICKGDESAEINTSQRLIKTANSLILVLPQALIILVFLKEFNLVNM